MVRACALQVIANAEHRLNQLDAHVGGAEAAQHHGKLTPDVGTRVSDP
jgi:hypothetical protein